MLAGSITALKLVGTDITSVGTITTGTWSGSVIGSNVGGAGTVSGVMKANGSGVVSAAVSGSDFQAPYTNLTNIGSLSNSAGYLKNVGSGTFTYVGSITDADLSTIATAGKVSNSATTATSANTASAIVARDASGNFTANIITGTLSGTATNVSGIVDIANGGTGSSTKNFVDLTAAQTIAGAKTFSGITTISNASAATSTSTGALIVSGGAGITGAVYAGSIQNTPVGSTTASTGAFTTLTASGATTLSGTLAVGGTGTFSSTLTAGASTLASASITGVASVGGTFGVTGATTLTGATTISNTTGSTSTSTGALVVRGGVGVAGNLTVGGTIEIDGGSPGAGKVLVSDANGLASWSNAVGSTVLTSTTNYAITLAEAYVFYNGASAGSFTIPAAAAGNAGKAITIKNKTAFGITITPASGTIFIDSANSGAANAVIGIEASNNWIKLVSDGSQWNVIRALF